MSKVMLLVGTRKGCFVLESDGDRRDWNVRGPYCEGWPIYHAVYDHDADAIYAAAASEWHGATVWRSGDRGETWTQSSEGLGYGDDGLKLSKVSSLSAAHGRVLAGAEQAGIFESRDAGATWNLKTTTLDEHPASKDWNDPAKQPPGHLGVSAIIPHPDGPEHFWAIVQGYSLFETTDDGATWTARNDGLRAEWPREYDDIGFCVHKVVLSPDLDRMYQQNHCGMHRSDDGGHSWTEITEGLPSDFGFAAAAHPHDRDTFYVIPVDPGHARTMHDGKASVWRTRDAGSSWQRLYQGLPQEDAYLGVLREGMTNDALDSPGFYFGTSTGQVFASVDEGDSWSEIAGYLPAISSVEVAVLQ
jgi:photosystem II stability/assembly factor-like uncharacterized protein